MATIRGKLCQIGRPKSGCHIDTAYPLFGNIVLITKCTIKTAEITVQFGNRTFLPQCSIRLSRYFSIIIAQAKLKIMVLVKVKMCSSQYPDIIGRGIGNQNFLPKIGIGLMDALYTDDRFKLFPLWEVVQYIVIKSIEFHIQSSFGMFPFLFVLLMLLMLFMLLMVMMVLK